MEHVEPLLEPVEAAARLVGVDRDGDLVALSVVAHVRRVCDRADVLGDPFALEPLAGTLAEPVEDRPDLGCVGVGEDADVGLRELVAEVRHEVADRAQDTGRGRHEHGERPHDLGDRIRV